MGSYDTTMGSLLLGILFNTFLYGFVVQQFVAYYQTKSNDRPAIKYMVAMLFILDTFHSISVIYMAWNYLVTNHNNPPALEVIGWPYAFTPLSTALAALATQLILGHRIWLFTEKNNILYGLIILLATPSFALGVISSVETWNAKVFSELPLITAFMVSWLSTQVLVGLFITITFIVIFSRSRTGFPSTDTVLDRLTLCAIYGGFLACIFCMAVLITFVVYPGTVIHGMIAIPIGRVYTITLLYMLLMRDSIKKGMALQTEINLAGLGIIASSPNSPVYDCSMLSARITGDV